MDAQIQNLLAQPQRAVEIAIVATVAVVFVAIFMRRAVRLLFGLAIFVGSLAVIIGGLAILMNNVSLSGPPGAASRLRRFLTVDWAATSESGNGAAACTDVGQLVARAPAAEPRRVARRIRRAAQRTPAESEARTQGVPGAGAGAAAGAGASDDYPELVRRAYPGIVPQRLLQIAASTVSGLPGWAIVKTDPKTLTIEARYRTRVFGFADDVRIVVTPRSEVDVCSRSRTGEPGVLSPVSFFHGDFGANIGHIKEFYMALAPAMDQAYRQEELRQTAAEHGIRF
jgi:hypothetical protein